LYSFFFFFFFQAEDGIRDGHVTGVQTCALPIFTSPTTTPWPTAPGAPGKRAARSACRPRPSGSSRPAAAWTASRSPGATKPGRKIGRASCRERGWGAGGGGSVEKKRVGRRVTTQ